MEKAFPQKTTDNHCQDVVALIPAYSIGATDSDESEFVQRNLADCPDAAAELNRYAKMAEALHYAAPPVAAPAQLVGQLQSRLRQTTPTAVFQPPTPLRPIIWVLAAAVIAVLVVNLYSVAQFTQMRSRQDELEAHISDQNRALMLLGLGTATRIELTSNQTGKPDIAYAAIVWNPKSEYVLLYVKDFPILPPDQVYELWLQRNGQYSSAGTFQTDVDGIGTLFFKTSLPVIDSDSIIITHEFSNDSTQPTLPPVVAYKRQ